MTLKELQRWILKNDEEDSWWVALDGEVQEDVMALPDISKFKDQHTNQQVSLLHVSKAEDENAEWIIFERVEVKNIKISSGGRQQFRIPPTKRAPQVTEAEEADETEAEAVSEPVEQAAVDSELRAEVATLRKEVQELRADLEQFKELADQLRQPLDDARAILEERENFLEIGENALFEKAQKQEVLQTELEQLRDELSKRERYVEAREKDLASKAAG